MISVVIPIIDNIELTNECITQVRDTTTDCEIIVIDNGSDSIKKLLPVDILLSYKRNIGLPMSFVEGFWHATNEIICFIHNDVLVYEKDWDSKVAKAFANTPGLGLAGFFGAKGVEPNGARMWSMSNMQGRAGGGSWTDHGCINVIETVPAASLDGLAMIFSKACLIESLPFLESDLPPHHWYDRILAAMAVENGYKVAVIGIEFDHLSGRTANSSKKYAKTAEEWCIRHGVEEPIDGTWDLAVYREAEKVWNSLYGYRCPLLVEDTTWEYRWSNAK